MKPTPAEFARFTELYNLMKRVKQLSWTVTQFEKKFPYSKDLEQSELKELHAAYLSYGGELIAITEDFQDFKKST